MSPRTTHRANATRAERRQAQVRRRRELATARSVAARRARRRKHRLQALAVVAALAVVGGTVAYMVLRPEPQPSRQLRAEKVPGATGQLGITAPPAAYRAVYRAESFSGSKDTVTTENVEIRRPFDARVIIHDGPPPGGAVRFQGRSSLGLYANYPESGAPQIAANPASVALGDVRIDASLEDLVARGLFVPGDRRRALGRECQVYRTGSPLQSVKITAPTASDYADTCLDDAGLILEEVTVAGGKLTQRLTATSIDTNPTLDPDAFTMQGERVGADQGGVDITGIDRTVPPIPAYWTPDAAPAGFDHQARDLIKAEGTSYMDVFVNGIDMVTVRQGPPDAEPDMSDAGPEQDVDLGALGPGKVIIASNGTTIVAHPGSNGFVHVAGTIAPADLEAIARGLHQA